MVQDLNVKSKVIQLLEENTQMSSLTWSVHIVSNNYNKI